MARTVPPSFVEIGPKLRVVAPLTRAWDGKEVARVGEGEEGVLVGSAEPGDPSLAGGPVLPMKLRVIWSGICLLSLCSSFYSICHSLRPPRLRSADGLARAGTSNILTH